MDFIPYKKQIESLVHGKRLPDATYVHSSVLSSISQELAEFTFAVATKYATEVDWNVVKFSRRDFKLSLLSYPTFDDESYPPLRRSVTIDIVRKKARVTDYTNSENPPILHRKETLVSPKYPKYSAFAAITKEGELLGLYEKSTRIGFKKSWELLISNKGFKLVDGHIVPKSIAAPLTADESLDAASHQ